MTIDGSTPRLRHILALAGLFGLLYGLTANWSLTANVDAVAAALPAWSLAVHGTPFLESFASANPWMAETPDGWVSNRPPGLIALAIPLYLLVQPEVFSNAPATAAAVAATVGALILLYVTLCRVVSPSVAMLATVVMGAGTSTWQYSANALWPHGPGQLWAALGVFFLSDNAYARSGWAFAAALLTRPVTAISTAVIGLAEGWRERSVRPVLRVGLPAVVGLGGLFIYNRLMFGGVSVSGGYPASFTDRVTDQPSVDHLGNAIGFFLSPSNGLFVWSPIVLAATVGVVLAWRELPGWSRSALIAAFVYVVVHARLNRVSGGAPFGYRYPLEALMLAAPGLTLGALRLWNGKRVLRLVVVGTIAASVTLQVALVLLLECEPLTESLVSCGFF